MDQETKHAKVTLFNYLRKEREEMSRNRQKEIIRAKDYNTLIKELREETENHSKIEDEPVVMEILDEIINDGQ